jgi:hypothetical protein
MSMVDELPASIPAQEVARCSGITYRQLDYWTTQGWLRPDERPAVTGQRNARGRAAGTGYFRYYSVSEFMVAFRMGELINAGLRPSTAARIARAGIEQTAAVLEALGR